MNKPITFKTNEQTELKRIDLLRYLKKKYLSDPNAPKKP